MADFELVLQFSENLFDNFFLNSGSDILMTRFGSSMKDGFVVSLKLVLCEGIQDWT